MVKTKAGLRLAVTILRQVKDLEGVLAIEPGVTLTRTTGRRDLNQGCSGAGTVGDHAIGVTSTSPGADVNRNR